MFHSYGVEDAFNDAFQGSIHKNDSYTMLPTLKKMHGTAWKLIGDYVAEVAPVWDISIPKTAHGVACPWPKKKYLTLFWTLWKITMFNDPFKSIDLFK